MGSREFKLSLLLLLLLLLLILLLIYCLYISHRSRVTARASVLWCSESGEVWVRVLSRAANKTPHDPIPDQKSCSSLRIIIENSLLSVLCRGATGPLSQHERLIQNRTCDSNSKGGDWSPSILLCIIETRFQSPRT